MHEPPDDFAKFYPDYMNRLFHFGEWETDYGYRTYNQKKIVSAD